MIPLIPEGVKEVGWVLPLGITGNKRLAFPEQDYITHCQKFSSLPLTLTLSHKGRGELKGKNFWQSL
jgi:hypothetical protein